MSRNEVKPQFVWILHHLGASVIARRPIKQGHGIYISTYYMTQAHPQQILSYGPSLSNMESSELISSQELKHPVGENNRVCIQMYPQRDSKALQTPVILLTTLLFTPALVRCFALTGKLSSNLISVRPNTAKDRQRADSLEVYKDVRTQLEDLGGRG